MPTFNRVATFERALLSVVRERQDHYPELEIVVIDGASKDGTADLIRKHAAAGHIDFWLSEPDRSASEAFNKGVRAAQGELLRYVACDDELTQGCTRKMVEYLGTHPEIDVLGARANFYHVHPDGRQELQPAYQALQGGWLTEVELLTWVNQGVFGPIETWFFRRHVFARVGGMDPAFRICPDLDLAFRIVQAGMKFYIHPDRIVDKCFHESGGNLVADEARKQREWREVLLRHVGRVEEAWLRPPPTRVPLPEQLFFGAWLAGLKAAKRVAPGSYAAARRFLRSAAKR